MIILKHNLQNYEKVLKNIDIFNFTHKDVTDLFGEISKMAEIGEYCKSLIEKICSEIGPRPSYSQEANQAAQLIQSEMG